MIVTPVYAALIAILFIGLSARTIMYRGSTGITLGDGDDVEMRRRVRVHANCAEYAPLGLLLLAIVELQGASPMFLHALGILLLAGRVVHAYGVSQSQQILAMRVAGMAMTLTQIALAAIAALALTVF